MPPSYHRASSCYIDTKRCPKGMRLLNRYASLRGLPVQKALEELLLDLPGKIAKLQKKYKQKPQAKRKNVA